MLSLHQLRCFLAAYEHGSLTAAAEELGYPVVFDWMFLHWYFVNFTGASPFGFSGASRSSCATARGSSSTR